MGGHYGSIHVRTNNRDEVRVAIENLQHESAQRFYIAPPIDGWVTVFPENNGQDESVAESLVEKLPEKTIIYCAVHDDDIFAYWFFENGKLSDSYNSCPEYFGDPNPPPRGGNAAAFANLLSPQKIKKLQALLDRKRFTFEFERQDQFAELLGLPNTAAAYEYIKSGDVGALQQRKEFIHVPDLSLEREARRAEQTRQREELKHLKAKKILLVDIKSAKSKFSYKALGWAQNPGAPEVIAGWCDLFDASAQHTEWKKFAGPSWIESEIKLPFGASINGLALSNTGDRLAIPRNSKLEIWDIHQNELIAERQFSDLVTSATFGIEDKWLFVTIRGNPKPELHRIALHPGLTNQANADEISHCQRVIPHPDGQSLAVIDSFGILMLIDIESMRIVTQRWIRDKNALMQFDTFKNIADSMVENVSQFMTPEEMKNYRKEAMRSFLPSEKIRVACFNTDGSWIFCGAQNAVHGLPWKELIEGPDMTPIEAAISVQAEKRPSQNADPNENERLVYAVLFDPKCDRVLFSGLEGKVSYYNIHDRRYGTLLTVPADAAFTQLSLTVDRSALIATAYRFDFDDLNKQHPQHFQIWNYRALCDAAGLEFE